MRKTFPHLSACLQALIASHAKGVNMSWVLAPLALIVGGGLILAARLLPGAEQTGLTIVGAALGMATGVGLLVSFARKKREEMLGRGDDYNRLMNQATLVARRFQGALQARKLHRGLHPAAASLLENSAENHRRLHDILHSTAWRHSDLPDYWRSVRDSSLKAADYAIAELLVLLETAYSEPTNPQGWQEAVEHVLTEVGLMEPGPPPGGFPPEYEPARRIAARLAELRREVERVSAAVIASKHESIGGADRILEASLSELRMIQEADSEVQLRLGHDD